MEGNACMNCCEINFDAYFGLSPEYPSIPSISFTSAMNSAPFCPFCDLLVSTTRYFTGRNSTIGYRAWPNAASANQPHVFYLEREYCRPLRDKGNVEIRGGGIMKVKLFPPPFPLENDLFFKLCPIFTCLSEELTELQHSACFVAEDQIDLALCRRWLRDCLEHHPSICQDYSHTPIREFPSGFRLIDVIDECVSEQNHGCPYIALSYVWGQAETAETLQLRLSNVHELQTKHSLSKHKSKVAQTILDAMEVVRTMGERYLWVDCLCIVQDGPDVSHQIGSMDRIYGAAMITVVASTGGDANVGLAGVHARSRNIPQLTREVWPDLELAVSLPTPNELTSPWESRGWTFQEQLLSKRFLIFREGQVVWQCPSQTLCEDTSAENKIRPFQRLRQISTSLIDDGLEAQQSDRLVLQPKPLLRSVVYLEYASIVAEYTKKRLTYTDDILRAFEGLSRILETHFHSKFISGLPETYLDIALLWIPQTVLEKRQGSNKIFPSWAWSGWVGGAGYEETGDARLERTVPIIKWYLKEGNSQAVPINGVGIGIDEKILGGAKSINTCLWFPVFEILSGRIGYVPEAELPNEKQMYLQFWTSCAFFKIDHNRSNIRDAVDNSIIGRKPNRCLIRSSHNQVVGYLILDGLQPRQTDVNCHEFIVVSEAQVSGFNPLTWAIQYSEKCLMYNVLLVEWDDGHQIASRVGIGRVLKAAWNEAGSRIKFVTLG